MTKQKLDDVGHLENSSTILLSTKIKNITDKFILEELADSENTQTKKDYFLQIATQFQIEGVPNEKISMYSLLAIEDRLYQKLSGEGIPKEQCKLSPSTLRHFRRTMEHEGFTDPFYARNKNDKDPKPKEKTEFQIENKLLIEMFIRQKDIIPDIISWLGKNNCTSKLNQKQLDEFLTLTKQNHQNFYDIFNNKEKLIPVFQHIFNYYMSTEVSISYTIASYLEKIKTIGTITRKQAVRCQKRLLKGIHPNLEPDSYDVAVFMGFVGQRCPTCNGYKVVIKEDACHRYKAQKPQNSGRYSVGQKRCSNCEIFDGGMASTVRVVTMC